MKIGKTLQDIKRKSKEQSKRKNYMGWFQSFGGEAPINNAFFNMAMGTADSPTVGTTSADGSVGAVSSVGEKLQKGNKEFTGDNKMKNGKDTVTLYLDESHSEEGKIVVDKDDVVKAIASLLYYSPEYIDKDDEEIESDILSNFDKDVDLYYNDLIDIFYKPAEDCAYDCDNDPYFLQYTFDGIDSDDPKIEVTEYESPSEYKFDEDWNDIDFDDEDADDRFELIDRKTVYDSNGFTTEYSMYYDSLEDKYVMVFGDSDLYRPEDEDYDAEFDDEKTAREWFDNYNGFEDEEEEDYDFEDLEENKKYIKSNYSESVSPYDELQYEIDDSDDLDNRKFYEKMFSKKPIKNNSINEGEVKEIDIEMQEDSHLEDKLKKDIDALNNELNFLKNQAPREIKAGGAFESQEEIDDAIKATEREKDRLVAKYKIIMRGKNK